MSDTVGTSVRTLAGRYQIGELLGRGGMSEVYRGHDKRLGRRVAIKLLRPGLAENPQFRVSFRQEAQAAAQMAHPTIVRVFDAGEEIIHSDNNREIHLPFIVMELIDGSLLSNRIADGPLNPSEAIRIATGILTALEYSHTAGIIHRDVKPNNIMITVTGQVKVMDFGIARAIQASHNTIAETSTITGTADYFSPEQARGEALDARADIYSTGVVLYEMLTGQPPFSGENPVAVAYRHISELAIPPHEIVPAVSPALSAVIMHALNKNREERFKNAADFRADLTIAMTGKVPDHIPDNESELNLIETENDALLRRLASDDDRPARSQNRPPAIWVWSIIAVMATVIVAAVLWVFNLETVQITGPSVAVEVPDVAGLSSESALNNLTEAGLRPRSVARADENVATGFVIGTNIPPGTRVSPEEVIQVYVSSGAPRVTLPSLAGRSESDAKTVIDELGLSYGSTSQMYSPSVPSGQIIGVRVNEESATLTGQQSVAAGSTINIVISNGLVQIPDLTGQQIDAARTELETLQLLVRLSPQTSCTGGMVTGQSALGDAIQRSEITVEHCLP